MNATPLIGASHSLFGQELECLNESKISPSGNHRRTYWPNWRPDGFNSGWNLTAQR